MPYIMQTIDNISRLFSIGHISLFALQTIITCHFNYFNYFPLMAREMTLLPLGQDQLILLICGNKKDNKLWLVGDERRNPTNPSARRKN
jgi:hypothetical protein